MSSPDSDLRAETYRPTDRGPDHKGRCTWLPWAYERRSENLPRLYCFPHAGGAASAYASWRRLFSGKLDVQPIELPGRGRRRGESPAHAVGPMISDLLLALSGEPMVPYYFWGHSMGGILAYEATRQLLARGLQPPRCIFVAASRPPGAPLWRDFSDKGILSAIDRLGGTPEDVLNDSALMGRALPTLRADFEMLDQYQSIVFAQKLPVPVVAMSGEQDSFAGPEWGQRWSAIGSSFHHYVLEGGHFFPQSTQSSVQRIVLRAIIDSAT